MEKLYNTCNLEGSERPQPPAHPPTDHSSVTGVPEQVDRDDNFKNRCKHIV